MAGNENNRGELIKSKTVITACRLEKEEKDKTRYRITPMNNAAVTLNYLISDAGGQGDVYHVTYRGQDYALKWYCKNPEDVIGGSQFDTIAKICGAEKKPGKEFVWPLIMAGEMNTAEGKRFGYLMELLPENYYEMDNFLKGDDSAKAVRFNSYHSMLVAGMNIAAAMQKLHLKGYSYKDLNPKNFAINPSNGDVLVVDNDNVSVDGSLCSVRGMKGYMAPEIPRSNYKKSPDRQTDYYSLAVILYRLFFLDNPMEGKAWEKYPMHTEEVEDYLYAIKPVFHLDPNNDTNRPSAAFAQNVMQRWRFLPLELRKQFIVTFTEGIDQIEKRSPENAWITMIAKVRDRLIRITKDKEHFVNFADSKTVPRGCLGLKMGAREIALYPQKALYQISIDGNVHEYGTMAGGVVYDKTAKKLMLRNFSNKIWRFYSPDTKQVINVSKGQEHPLYPGVMIEFQHEQPRIVGEVFDAGARR